MKNNKEISVKSLINIFIIRKVLFIKVLIIAFIISLVYTFTSRKEYNNKIEVISISNSSQSGIGGLLQQFGGLTGVNISNLNNGDLITSNLYPNVLRSTPFMYEVLKCTIHPENHKEGISVLEYLSKSKPFDIKDFIKDNTINKISELLKSIRQNHTSIKSDSIKFIQISEQEENVINELNDRVNISIDKINGIITISILFPDAYASAELAELIVELLNKKVIEFRIKKAELDCQFIKERFNEIEKKFLQAQTNLARFRDMNKFIVSSSFKTEEERLIAEFNLANNLYVTFATNYEQSKLKVQENTPALKYLNPAKIPLKKEKPSGLINAILFCFLACIGSFCYILFKDDVLSKFSFE